MAAPTKATISGGAHGFNGKLTHASLGVRYIRVESIQQDTSINTAEDAATQAKTLYPKYVAQGNFTVRIVFPNSGERDALAVWIQRFMELSSAGKLETNYLDISVPVRRFQRRGIPRGRLVYGSDISTSNKGKSMTLTFVGAIDPIRDSQASRMKTAPNDPVASYFYPAGIQVGWDTIEEVYDVPPIRPGMPNRPV